MIQKLAHYEPVWLLALLGAETVISTLVLVMSMIEFKYDKEWNEHMAARKVRQARAIKDRVPAYVKEMD